MGKQSCLREFVRYTILNVLGMIGLSCYILADTFFISKGLGANGLTALNLAIPIYSFIHGCGLMLGVGGATKYAIFKAQGMTKNANQVFTNVLYAAGIVAVIFVTLSLCLSKQITGLLGADSEVFEMTHTYLRMIMLFAPAFIMNDIFQCFVRNDGNPVLSMTAMLAGSFSNVILDYIFIFPLQMGIFGAVLATGFAPVISMVIMSGHRCRKDHFRLIRTKIQIRMTKDVISLGVPSLISEVASGVVIMVFNMLILGLRGNVGVAAYGVVANLSLVVVSIYTGIAQGMQPLCSKYYGKNSRNQVRQILHYAVATMLGLSVVIYAGMFSFANPIALVFNSEQNMQLQQMAVQGLRIYFLAAPFVGFNIVLSMFFTSTEQALPAQVISMLRGLILIIPMAFLLTTIAGLTGVWLTFPITEGIVFCIGIVLYRKIKNDKMIHAGGIKDVDI